MWKTVRLGEIAKAVGGNGFPKKYQGNKNKDIPFFKVSDMNTDGNEKFMLKSNNFVDVNDLKEMKAKLHPAGTIIFPKIGGAISTNKKRILTKDAAIDNNVMGVVSSNKILPEYLYKVFLNIDLYELSNKAALPSINNGTVNDIDFVLPPLSEQERIVAKLDAAFAEIDNEIRLCKQNIDNSNTLFNSQLDYIFNNKNLSKSKEWIKSPLKDLCNNFKADIVDGPFGSNLKKSDYIDSGTEVLKIQNIKPFYINNKKMSFVSKTKYHELIRHSFASGDIIMTKLGEPLGVSAIVKDLKKGLIVADLIRIRAAKINTKFLCYQLNSPSINRYINSQQTGSGRKRIRLSVARELPIVHPSLEVQHEIVKSLDKIKNDIESLLNNYNLKLNNLESLKSSILKHTLSENIKGNAA